MCGMKKRYGKTPKLKDVRRGLTKAECWPWPGRVDHHGQPAPSGHGRPARIFYEALVGKIPAGMVLKKTCGNVVCVNPYHMEPIVWDRGVVREIKRKRIPREKKEIVIADGVAFVPVGRGLFAQVDEIDLPLIEAFVWHTMTHLSVTYAVRAATESERKMGAPKNIRMHRVIAPPPDGLQIDHKDRNGLNNRRSNLRHVTHGENLQNRVAALKNKLGLKGVYEAKDDHQGARRGASTRDI